MIRTQIQLTEDQARALKRLASREGKSVAELIRISVEKYLRSGQIVNPEERIERAIAAAGRLKEGPQDLSAEHDRYLRDAFEK